MTDLAELRRLAEAARCFTHTDGELQLDLRLPTSLELQLLAVPLAGCPPTEFVVRLAHASVLAALTGWRGVRECDLAAGAPETEAEFSRGAAELLLEARPRLAEALRQAVTARLDAQEQAEKNSPGACAPPLPVKKQRPGRRRHGPPAG